MARKRNEAAAALEAAVSWPLTIKLKHPIAYGSTEIDQLTFRRGKLGDLKGIEIRESFPIDDLMLVAGRLCGQTVAVMERLDEADAQEVCTIALGFIGRCLPS